MLLGLPPAGSDKLQKEMDKSPGGQGGRKAEVSKEGAPSKEGNPLSVYLLWRQHGAGTCA